MALQKIGGKTYRTNVHTGQWYVWTNEGTLLNCWAWVAVDKPAYSTAVPMPYVPPTQEQIAADNTAAIADYAAVMDSAIPAMREALMRSDLSHTRQKRGFVHAYRYDTSSPTGVMLICSLEVSRYDALMEDMRGLVPAGALSPLSPTEAR